MSDKHYARILVTAALPYANGPAHLGHIAGAYLPADIYCRYQRLMGRDVAVHLRLGRARRADHVARAQGRRLAAGRRRSLPRRCCATASPASASASTTTAARRRRCSTRRARSSSASMAQKHAFVLKSDSQLYDPEAQMFLADRFVRGTCPTCGNPDAYGDQCERCGRTLSPKELIEPRSAITQARPELRETTHWYLPLGAQQGWLEHLARLAPGLEAERRRPGQELAQGRPRRSLDDARPAVGRAGARRRRQGRRRRRAAARCSTSGSTRRSATSPPRASGPSSKATRNAGRSTGSRQRRPSSSTSSARTTSSSTA